MQFLNNLPINWFDVVILVVIVTGLLHGRKHGMSEELLASAKWLAIVFGCAALYRTAGGMISQTSTFGPLTSNIAAYLTGAMLIAVVFALVKRAIGGKIVGSDTFGGGEYYLGMITGVARFACVMMAVLAILNARAYSRTEIAANLQYQKKEYGAEFFPGLHTVQEQVFEKSLTGPWIRNNLAFLLIQPTAPGGGTELKRRQFEMP